MKLNPLVSKDLGENDTLRDRAVWNSSPARRPRCASSRDAAPCAHSGYRSIDYARRAGKRARRERERAKFEGRDSNSLAWVTTTYVDGAKWPTGQQSRETHTSSGTIGTVARTITRPPGATNNTPHDATTNSCSERTERREPAAAAERFVRASRLGRLRRRSAAFGARATRSPLTRAPTTDRNRLLSVVHRESNRSYIWKFDSRVVEIDFSLYTWCLLFVFFM